MQDSMKNSSVNYIFRFLCIICLHDISVRIAYLLIRIKKILLSLITYMLKNNFMFINLLLIIIFNNFLSILNKVCTYLIYIINMHLRIKKNDICILIIIRLVLFLHILEYVNGKIYNEILLIRLNYYH